MKRNGFIVIFCLSALLSGVDAQQNIKWRGSNYWGLTSKYEMAFDNYNLQTYLGKISKIDTISPLREMSYGVFMIIKNNTDEYTVHLGPGWYILFQDIGFGVGSDVEVKGCRVTLDNKEFIVASEVNYKDKVLKLRDEEGIPNWCAFRKKNQMHR
jgi:hypothetical protein